MNDLVLTIAFVAVTAFCFMLVLRWQRVTKTYHEPADKKKQGSAPPRYRGERGTVYRQGQARSGNASGGRHHHHHHHHQHHHDHEHYDDESRLTDVLVLNTLAESSNRYSPSGVAESCESASPVRTTGGGFESGSSGSGSLSSGDSGSSGSDSGGGDSGGSCD